MNGIEFNARLEKWQFFVTLTFRDPVPSEPVRLKVLFAWLRTISAGAKGSDCRKLGPVHFHELLWLVRSERGEKTGRLHFHALLGGLPAHRVNRTECFWQQHAWEQLHGGMARVRMYDARFDGVAYTLKGLGEGSRAGANDYELAKFVDSEGCLVITSHAALGKWRGTVRRGGGGRTHGIPKTRKCDNTARRGQSVGLKSVTSWFKFPA